MRAGAEDGDLVNEQGPMVSRIVMLDAPTEVVRLSCEGDAAWRLITQFSPHSIELTRTGLAEVNRPFRQFTAYSEVHTKRVDGLTNLSHRAKQLWLPGKPMPSFVWSLEVTLTVDEQAFAAVSLNAFISVMDHCFTVHAPTISFVQLVVMSANTGGEIRRCAPRPGTIPLAWQAMA
ncbi:type VI secretion system baseplate subunit TssF [Burkholderia latens]|uniref:type VI secretion system baseplate subunit TssF n=1 Tax=Burkholderia latens TaxID=488446 RepID=UPI0039A748C7